jgi:FkbM family methyltransferase
VTIPFWLTRSTEEIEQVARAQAQASYFGDHTVLCRVLGKYLLYADTNDVGITPHLSLNGYWESWITLAISRLVQPGFHCLDIGANHGYYTLLMADGAGPTGRVTAVEPNPSPAQRLMNTLDVNGLLRHTLVVQKAASHLDGETVNLFVVDRRGMNASLTRQSDDARSVAVETITVDRLVDDWSRVDLLKIDVEGAEENVWHGMASTLDANPELVILLEVNTSRYDAPAEFFGTIESAGFVLRYIDFDGGIKPISRERLATERHGEDWMLFLRRELKR